MSAELIAELTSKLEEHSKTIDAKMAETAKLSEEKQKESLESYKKDFEEYKTLSDELKKLRNNVHDLEQKGVTIPKQNELAKSIGQTVVESKSFGDFVAGSASRTRLEVKNTITNNGNATSRHDQLAGVVGGAFRMLNVMGTVMQGQASSNVIYYSREASWTNAAAGTAEGAAKPESTLTFEEVETSIRTIPTFLKISKQAIADSTFVQSYIDSRMSHGVNNKIESQIINGDGTGQEFSGWLASGNSTAVAVGTAENFFDYTLKLKYAVISADYAPDYFYVNPADWSAAEGIKVGASDARYVGADGAIAYVNNGLQPMLWGLPVVLSNNVPAGTVICKSADADMYVSRESVTVEMFEQDSDNVQKNLVTVRAEARGALLVMSPAAIVTADLSTLP